MPVELSKLFDKKFDGLPLEVQRKVSKAVWLLNSNFRHPGLKTHQLESHPGIYEARVDDKYRMTYERQGNKLIMRNVDNHDECLKNP